jgi:hypothetical protein
MRYASICNLSFSELKEQFPIVGRGSSRIVFDLSGGTVLKMVRVSAKGQIQHETELELHHYAQDWTHNRLCPILHYSNDKIICRKAIPLNTPYHRLSPELIPIFRRMRVRLHDFELIYREGRRTEGLSEPYEKLINLALYQDIECLISNFCLLPGDLFKRSSWGYWRKKFVLIDYGLKKNDFVTLYA